MHFRKHGKRGPAEPSQSAEILRPGMALTRYRPLQYALLLLLTLFIMAAVAVLSTRSIWIDEATLLRSVFEIDLLDFLHPLPYYNQASPFLPSVVIKLVSEVAGTNFILFRTYIFTFVLICAMPFAIKITRMFGLNGLLTLVLVCAANVYNVLLYATEIKHYGFEIGGVFIFLYWFLIYLKNPEEALVARRVWVPLLAISMGFSTLLLAASFFLFVAINSVVQHNKTQGQFLKNVVNQHALVFVLMAATAVAAYAFMSYLTMFQMSDNVYKSAGYKEDIGNLLHLIQHAFRHIFLLTIVLSISSLFLKTQTILFRFNLFFLSTLTVVVILKLLGFYPVIYSKHVVWMVPIGLTLIAMYIHIMLLRKEVFGLFLIIFISVFVVKEGRNLYRFYIPEINSKNALYTALENIRPADILVFRYA